MNKKYPIVLERVLRSPFSSVEKVKETLVKYKKGESIGFTYLASLRSMGLVPRSDGTFRLGAKYQF